MSLNIYYCNKWVIGWMYKVAEGGNTQVQVPLPL